MNKKIMSISILAVFMLVAISFASAVGQDSFTDVEKKESPLFKIRTRHAIGQKIVNILANIKSKFLAERIIFLPIKFIKNFDDTLATTAQWTDCWDTCKNDGCPTFLAICNK